MEAIYASDLHSGLEQLWQKALNYRGPVIILADAKEQIRIENELIKRFASGAFMHIQVMSLSRLALETFARHRLFKKRIMSHLEALVAGMSCLELEGLTVFDKTAVTISFLEELIQCFETLSDCPRRSWSNQLSTLSRAKLADLEKMYAHFVELKKEALFGSEIYWELIDLLQDSYVLFCLPRATSLAQQAFIQKVPGAYLELRSDEAPSNWQSRLLSQFHRLKPDGSDDLPFAFYQLSSKQDELAYVIESIASQVMAQKGRYQDFCIYLESTQDIEDLQTYADMCQVPLKVDPAIRRPYALSYVHYYCEHILSLTDADVTKLYHIARQCMMLDVDEVQYGLLLAQDRRLLTQCEHVKDIENILLARWQPLASVPFKKLFEGWDVHLSSAQVLMFYREMASFVSTSDNAKKQDRVYVTTYAKTYLASFFKQTYFTGLNEDIYPSRVKDGGLLLEAELASLYPEGTPRAKQAQLEKEQLLWLILLSQKSTFLCYRGALDGTTYLPSLLFSFLRQLAKAPLRAPETLITTQASARYHGYYLPSDQKALQERYAASLYQPEPLPSDLTFALYAGHVSPSQLECFNGCPYQHFLRYGLGLVSPGKDEHRRLVGILMHDLLDECALLFKGDFEDQLQRLCALYQLSVADLDTTLASLCEAMMEKRRPAVMDAEMQYLWEIFPMQFLQTLKMLLSQAAAGQFQLAYHETALKDRLGPVALVGRIDRGDVYEGYLKVLDYKSSGKTLDLGLAIQGFQIQMLVYLDMLCKAQELKKGAVLYFNTALRKISSDDKMHLDVNDKLLQDFERNYRMQGWLVKDERHQVMSGLDQNYTDSRICNMRYVKSRDDYTGNLLSPAQFERLLALVHERMEAIVETCFEKGDIRIYPAGSVESSLKMKVSPCAYCAYRYICMRDPFYHEEREIQALTKDQVAAYLGEEEES